MVNAHKLYLATSISITKFIDLFLIYLATSIFITKSENLTDNGILFAILN